MNRNLLATADAYLQAWNEKNLEGIAEHLQPEVKFVGPMKQTTGRAAFLESARRVFHMLQNVKVRSTFSSGDQVMAAYDFICAEPIGVCRTAELMTFENALISRIELFYDARPFEKLAKQAGE